MSGEFSRGTKVYSAFEVLEIGLEALVAVVESKADAK